MKYIIAIILTLSYLTLCSQSKIDSLQNVSIANLSTNDSIHKEFHEQIDNLRNSISDLQSSLKINSESYNNTIQSVSTQLDSASYSLNVFATLFGIAAILLAIYITFIERKIVSISNESRLLFDRSKIINDEVQEINNSIHNDLSNLYKKLRTEEIKEILNRLIEVPEDINNVIRRLLSVELDDSDFQDLKKAYFNLETNKYKQGYYLVFSQHFFIQSMTDIDLKNEISKFIPKAVSASFKNDVISLSRGIIRLVEQSNLNDYKQELISFFESINKSSFKNNSEVYAIFCESSVSNEDYLSIFNWLDENKCLISKLKLGQAINKAKIFDKEDSVYIGFNEKLGKLEVRLEAEEKKKKEAEEKKTAKD